MSDIAVGLLLLFSAGLVLTAAIGLTRLPDFFQRLHAPALASTLGNWCVALASIVHFSMREEGLSLHVWLIAILLSITAPVTTMVLARAGLFRRRQAGDALPPPLGGSSAPDATDTPSAADER